MATNEDVLSKVIQRFAIDPSGRLGSLYDVYRDCILGQLNVRCIQPTDQPHDCTKFDLVTNVKRVNLLRTIGVERDLEISILLNLAPKMGVASLMDFSGPVNEYTRILNFRDVHRKEQLFGDLNEIKQAIQSSKHQTSATHVITEVSWGFYVVIILQLPPNKHTVQMFDDALEKLRTNLENDQDLLGEIVDIQIYSNVSELTRITTLHEVCHHINRFKHSIAHYPMTYTLRPIVHSHSACPKQDEIKFTPLSSAVIDLMQKNIFQMLCKIKESATLLNDTLSKSLGGCLKSQLYDIHQQWSSINKEYMKEIDRLSKLLIDCRSGQLEVAKIKEALGDTTHKSLERNITELTEKLGALKEKARLIFDLPPFKYCNVVERGVDENDTYESIQRKLVTDEHNDRILCTNDNLNKIHSEKFKHFSAKLTREHQENPSVRLIYADFSYTLFPLNEMRTFPSIGTDDDPSQPKPKKISSSIISPMSSTPPEIINILLLGETGVGKSTFINALVNYLTFDSLQNAEAKQPVILIPVSFLMTVGDQFVERMIELDSIHKTAAEHFNSFGQSVTQHCQSYILPLKNRHGQELRIIDTPGFGDTRGSTYDDRNMQQILEYITQLTHLNAICFLFKSNHTQLDTFFRSCITQLLDHLGPNARENIVFCFTNARATFYNPGDAAPLLKSILNALPVERIPFRKENTFCFDSEAFRYLAALQKNITFDDLNRSEYERSWTISVKESNRLIDYLSKHAPVYEMDHEQQSIKKLQYEIIHRVRPILETIRNILQNILLSMSDSPNQSIKLHAISPFRLATHCRSCRPAPVVVSDFIIFPDVGHEMQGNCITCQCGFEQHTPIEYILEYRPSKRAANFEKLNGMLLPLFEATIEIAHFLMYATHSVKEDPFFIGFTRMIEEEEELKKIQSNELNLQLLQQLENFLRSYKERMNNLKHQQWDRNLSRIQDQLKFIDQHPIISPQIAAMNTSEYVTERKCSV